MCDNLKKNNSFDLDRTVHVQRGACVLLTAWLHTVQRKHFLVLFFTRLFKGPVCKIQCHLLVTNYMTNIVNINTCFLMSRLSVQVRALVYCRYMVAQHGRLRAGRTCFFCKHKRFFLVMWTQKQFICSVAPPPQFKTYICILNSISLQLTLLDVAHWGL